MREISMVDKSLYLPQQTGLLVPGDKQLALSRFETVSHLAVERLEILHVNPFAKAVDVRPLLKREHPFWKGELLEVARQAQEQTIKGGSVPTSLEPTDHTTYYQPTNGLVIQKELPWLLKLFQDDFRYLVERATGDPSMHLGHDLASSLNMNYLQEGDYEKHTDRNIITALLGVTSIEEGEGGELVIYEKLDPVSRRPAGRRYNVRPQSGILYIFNGLTHPHEVTTLQRKTPRLVVPGDYYNDTVVDIVDTEFNKKIGVGTTPPAASSR